MSMNWGIASVIIGILSATLTGTLDREMPLTPLDSHDLPKGAAIVLEEVIYLLENHEAASISKFYDPKHHLAQVKSSGMTEEQYRVEILGLWVVQDGYMEYSEILQGIRTVTVLAWEQDKAGAIHVSAGVTTQYGSPTKIIISLKKVDKTWLLTGPEG